MVRACRLLVFGFAAACARPEHKPAPMPPPRPPTASLSDARQRTPTTVKVAVFESAGSGNWGSTLELSPAPASLVTPCLRPGAAGWVSVDVNTHESQASTTSIVEGSPDVSPDTRSCIANALTGVHTPMGAIRVLVYVTFSPE